MSKIGRRSTLHAGPDGTITVVDEILIRPAAENGPVPLVNLHFMFFRQDSGNFGRSAKSSSFSARYGRLQTAVPYPVFVSEAGEFKLLTTTDLS